MWGPSDVTPLMINTQSKYKVFASWQKKSWDVDEAIEYSGTIATHEAVVYYPMID